MEVNMINDNTIKEKMSNLAIKVLLSNKIAKHDEVPNIKFDFGYIYAKDDGEIEALFKAIINNQFYYFALQKRKFMMININEALYQNTILNMQKLHPCLNDTEN